MGLICLTAKAEVLDLTTALQHTYTACADIDDNLHDIKVLAGVNTAVTAVGTGLGVGATATGFVKQKTDKEIAQLEKILEKLKNIESNLESMPTNNTEQLLKDMNQYYAEHLNDPEASIKDTQQQINELTEKSKKLGNWRTGLLAGNTVTNVAGAIIASKTINKDDIEGQIEACVSATKDLNNAIMQAKMNGEDVTEAQSILEACREYEYVDITPINNRGKGAMIASSIGAVTGTVGTITSAIANTDKTRNDNTEEGKKKEKDLNTASNVLSIGSTVASTTATIFNATQIAAVKKVAKVSEACTGVLK